KGLEHRPHRPARDDAGPGRRRTQIDAACAVPAEHVVMQCTTFAQRHAGQIALRRVGGLADCFGDLTRLAVAEADAALLIAHDHQRRKAEAPSTLHHLGHAVDVHELVNEFALALLPLAALPLSSWFTCHRRLLSSRQNLRPPSRAASASALMRPW